MYEVILSAEAEDIYASADRALAKKIARCFEQL
jgi:mRNA interferase RelE/StbE